jgi:hypothetical protein
MYLIKINDYFMGPHKLIQNFIIMFLFFCDTLPSELSICIIIMYHLELTSKSYE